MTESGIMCGSGDVIRKAGVNASGSAITDPWTNDYIGQVESQINADCRYNFSDNYSSLNVDTKGLLKEVASNLAAIYVISYDMSGYTSRIEAEDMINILRDAALRGLKMLKDKKVTDFIREV